MGLFSRSGAARVSVAPEVVRPRQTVTVTVTTDKPLDNVGSARLEWGYDNFYRYHWAGRADSVPLRETTRYWTADRSGRTTAASATPTTGSASIGRDVPIAASEFAGTTVRRSSMPSWAPGSSPESRGGNAGWSSSEAARTSTPAVTSPSSSGPPTWIPSKPLSSRWNASGVTARPSSTSPVHRRCTGRARRSPARWSSSPTGPARRRRRGVLATPPRAPSAGKTPARGGAARRPNRQPGQGIPLAGGRRDRAAVRVAAPGATRRRRRQRCTRRCRGSFRRGCCTPGSPAHQSSASAARSWWSTRPERHAREIADASATCSAVGRTPV